MSTRLGNHLFGLEVERMFDAECERRGIAWALPISDQTSCDRVVITRRGPIAVQIKGNRIMRMMRKGRGRITLAYEFDNHRAHRRTGTKFFADGVSVLAVYCAPHKRWHLFRAAEVTGKRLRFGEHPTGRALKAIENWALLT